MVIYNQQRFCTFLVLLCSTPVYIASRHIQCIPLTLQVEIDSHCQAGMVFALNPTAEKTFNAFKASAMGASSSSNTSTTPVPLSISATLPATVGSSNTATTPTTSGTAAGALNPQDSGALSIGSMNSVAVVVAIVWLVSEFLM